MNGRSSETETIINNIDGYHATDNDNNDFTLNNDFISDSTMTETSSLWQDRYQSAVRMLARGDVFKGSLEFLKCPPEQAKNISNGIGLFTERAWPFAGIYLYEIFLNYFRTDPTTHRYWIPVYLSGLGILSGMSAGMLWEKRPEWCNYQDEQNEEDEDRFNLINTIHKIYNEYQEWSQGKRPITKENAPMHLLFMLLPIYILLAKFRLGSMFIRKFAGLIAYLLRENNCEIQQKQVVYMQDFAEKECTVCGDNPYVYYGDVFTSQGCLDGLLSESRPLSEISYYLIQILNHPDFLRLDFSKQSWTNWSLSDWVGLLDNISNVTSDLNTLNLSSTIFNPVFPGKGYADALSKFLSLVSVKNLDIRNQGLNDTMLEEIVSGLQKNANNSLQYLDLSSNRLTNYSVKVLQQLMTNDSKLNTLKLAHNRLHDEGINSLAQGISNGSLTVLDASDNGFGFSGAEAISNLIANPDVNLQKVDISYNDLSAANLTQLGHAVSKSTTLAELNLRHTNIDNTQADPFMASAKSTKTELNLDFSDNPLTDHGMFLIIRHANNSNITAINFNLNFLTDDGLSDIADVLNATVLKKFFMAYSKSFTNQGIKKIITNLPKTMLTLDISGNDLGDELADIFIQAFNGSLNCNLKSVYLGGNRLTDESGKIIVRLFAAHNVTDLSLDHNLLTDQTLQALAEVFPGEFSSLDFSYNQIANDTGMEKLADKLNVSRLQSFSAANNQLGDDSAVAVAKNLVKPDITNIGEETLPVKDIRALRKTKPGTNITKFDLANNQINTKGARALCRVLNNTNISKNNLILKGNPVSGHSFHDCQNITSPRLFAKRNERLLSENNLPVKLPDMQEAGQDNTIYTLLCLGVMRLPEVMLAMAALYLVYRSLKPLLTGTWNSKNNFFAEHKNTGYKNHTSVKNQYSRKNYF